MDIIVGNRGTGKTKYLIQMSAAGRGTIVVFTERSVRYIKDMANAMDVIIPDPITLKEFLVDTQKHTKFYLMDNASNILQVLGVQAAVFDAEEITFLK